MAPKKYWLILFLSVAAIAGCVTPAKPADPAQQIAAVAVAIGTAAADVEYARVGSLITGEQASTLKVLLQQALDADRAADTLRRAGMYDQAAQKTADSNALLHQVRAVVPDQHPGGIP